MERQINLLWEQAARRGGMSEHLLRRSSRLLVQWKLKLKRSTCTSHITPFVATGLRTSNPFCRTSYKLTSVAGCEERALLTSRRVSICPMASGGAGDAAGSKLSKSDHYAWAADIKKREEELKKLGVAAGPQAISPAAAPLAVASPVVGSAWNAAGTFEEREVSAKARQLLNDLSNGRTIEKPDGRRIVLQKAAASGTATLIFSRGKVKPGFEMGLTADWVLLQAEGEVQLARGSVSLEEIEDSQGSDCFGSMAVKAYSAEGMAGDSSAAVRVVKESVQGFRALITDFKDALKEL